MAGIPINTSWLEEGKEMAECPVCFMLLDQPTVGCPEGHALCRQCFVAELHKRKECPVCKHATDETRLQRCRPLELFIGQLRTRCKNGPEECAGGGEGGAAPRAKRAKLEPAQSMSADDLREELGRGGQSTEGKKGELAVRLEEHRRSDAGEEGAQRCSWVGKVCDLVGHLSESCAHEPMQCPNTVAGCKESVLRKDAARHASETCAYRKNRCAHCSNPFEARALPGHEGSCPSAQIECPNAGCGATVARGSMGEHRGVCGREEVGCPCPGCEERMARAEVGQHVAASGAEHVQRAWRRAADQEEKVGELEEKVAEQAEAMKEQGSLIVKQQADIAKQQGENAELRGAVVAQSREIKGLQRRSEALTRVFTWNTDSTSTSHRTPTQTFMDGVCGLCYNGASADPTLPRWMGFALEEGPACTMHFKCSIMDKNDNVLRVVSDPDRGDFQKPPLQLAPVGHWTGANFNLTAADTAGAGRANGSIKLRMVVHLYLPE